MTSTIPFGTFEISAVEYAVQSNAILGIRGSGKTYSATYIAERLMDAGIPFAAIDPVGIWKNLKVANPDGGKSYPVVVIGKGGDVPLSVETIEEVTLLMLQERASFVVDLFDENLSKDDWDQIVTIITKILLQKNSLYGLRHIFFEEAAEFVHQHGKKTESSEWIERLVRVAGNVQVGCTFINQRAEQLAKSILELSDGLFLHRQKGRLSIKAMQKWLDSGDVETSKEISKSLPNLQSGECWIWMTSSNSPQRVTVPKKNTLHPDRKAFVFSGALNTDLESVIDRAKSIESFYEKVSYPYLYRETETSPPPQPVEISTEIVWENVTDDQKVPDYKIYQAAKTRRYGTSTVADMIENLIRRGYTNYEEFGFNGAWLKSETNANPFNLEPGIQREYAKMLIRRLGL